MPQNKHATVRLAMFWSVHRRTKSSEVRDGTRGKHLLQTLLVSNTSLTYLLPQEIAKGDEKHTIRDIRKNKTTPGNWSSGGGRWSSGSEQGIL